MIRVLGLIFVLLPLSLLCSSCQSHSLVGEWVYESFEPGQREKFAYTFLKNGTYIQNIFLEEMKVPYPPSYGEYSQEGDLVILKPKLSSHVIQGRWKNDKLILTIDWGGTPINVPLTKK